MSGGLQYHSTSALLCMYQPLAFLRTMTKVWSGTELDIILSKLLIAFPTRYK